MDTKQEQIENYFKEERRYSFHKDDKEFLLNHYYRNIENRRRTEEIRRTDIKDELTILYQLNGGAGTGISMKKDKLYRGIVRLICENFSIAPYDHPKELLNDDGIDDL